MKLIIKRLTALPFGGVNDYLCINEYGDCVTLAPHSVCGIPRDEPLSVGDVVEIPDDTPPTNPTYLPNVSLMLVNGKPAKEDNK